MRADRPIQSINQSKETSDRRTSAEETPRSRARSSNARDEATKLCGVLRHRNRPISGQHSDRRHMTGLNVGFSHSGLLACNTYPHVSNPSIKAPRGLAVMTTSGHARDNRRPPVRNTDLLGGCSRFSSARFQMPPAAGGGVDLLLQLRLHFT